MHLYNNATGQKVKKCIRSDMEAALVVNYELTPQPITDVRILRKPDEKTRA